MLDSDMISGFFYLSNIKEEVELVSAVDLLYKKVRFIPEPEQSWYNHYLDYFKVYDVFPSFSDIVKKLQVSMDDLPEFDHNFSSRIFQTRLAVWESNHIVSKFPDMTLKERREALVPLAEILDTGENSVRDLSSSGSLGLVDITVLPDDVHEKFFHFPVKNLNDRCATVGPGHTISVIAAPGSGKTSFALEVAYQQLVNKKRNVLYFYLEDMEKRYMMNIYARHSYAIGERVDSSALKQGVYSDDEAAINKLNVIQESWNSIERGEIYFVPMSKLSPDPTSFAARVAQIVTDYEIDFMVTDYLQRLKTFTPFRWDGREYLNHLMSTTTSLALGQFNNRPFVNMVLAQPKREAEERALKTRGKMTLYDAAEVSAIERDSLIVLGLYSDPEMREANQLNIQILKNRDEPADVVPQPTTFMPQYCYIGDTSSSSEEEIYSQSAMNDTWDSMFEGM